MNQLEELIIQEKAKIIGETAKINWKELEIFYAQGTLILVSDTLNLVEVGFAISSDNTDQIRQWADASLLARIFDQQAVAWENENTEVWAVVIKPWILVQEPKL